MLNAKNCRYLIIGGWAFNFYADIRPTGDYDFFIGTSRDDEEKIRSVISDFGFGSALPSVDERMLLPDKVFMLGRKPFRIDLLTSISAVDFEEAWPKRVAGLLGGSPVSFISKDLLIRNKSATGRAKDQKDVAVLKES